MIVSIKKFVFLALPFLILGCVSSYNVIDNGESVSYSQLKAAPGEALIVVYLNDGDKGGIKPVNITLDAENVGKISSINGLAIRVSPGSYRVSTPFSDTFLIDVDVGEGDIVVCELKHHSKGYLIRESSHRKVPTKKFQIIGKRF